jgi:hypothetical protein
MGLLNCWLSDEDHSVWQLVTFYVPIGLCVVATVCMISHAIYIVVKIKAVTTKSTKVGRHLRTCIYFPFVWIR